MSNKQTSRLGDIINQVKKPRSDELIEKEPVVEEEGAAAAPAKRTTRPLAKSKDPSYKPTTLYVRRQTFNNAQSKLIGGTHDLSDVVDALLTKWSAGEIDI
jgi:hypothetical protein